MENSTNGGRESEWRDERARLAQFLEEMLDGLGRTERRRWGAVYVRGLLSTNERKTAARIATQLPDGEVQALQQFVGQSPWAWEPVREQLAQRMARELQPVAAWAVDDTGFAKKGTHSVGVARQYCGRLGKQDNCQVAVTLSIANHSASLQIAYRLYLPETWTADAARRARAGVPEATGFASKPEIALDQIRAARAAGVPPGVVLMDAGYGSDTRLRTEIAALGLNYIAGIQPHATAC